MNLVELAIRGANEQLERKVKEDEPILVIPRLDGGQETYTAKEVIEQSKDKDTEIGKVIRLGAKTLLRRLSR